MSNEHLQAIVSDGIDVDALVARYAPIGRQLRRRRKLTRIALALLVPVVGTLVWQSRDLVAERVTGEGDATRMDRELNEVRNLKMSLTAEQDAITAQRTELARQQGIFSKRNEELAAKLVAIDAQRKTLAEQSRQFKEQQAALARAIEKTEQQRRNLQAGTGSQSAMDRQLLDIERQKRELQGQQRRFLDQGRELARELGEINQQRAEIERQRQAIEAQQAEVRKLLEQANPVGTNRQSEDRESASAPAGEPLVADDVPPEDRVGGAIGTMAAVNPAVLGEMRGGVDVGQDFSFAFGITRTVTVNGVEQFSSAMHVNELSGATGMGDSTQTLQMGQPVIIQNGAGNFVDAGTLANMGLNNATIIQNTLDNQTITNQTVLDVSLQNVSNLIQGADLSRIARDGLSLPR